MRKQVRLGLMVVLPVVCLLLAVTMSVNSIYDDGEVLYVRAAAVYEGAIDERYSITEEALSAAARSFVGKPVLLGHDWINPQVCVGVITDSDVRYDSDLGTHYIEMVLVISDKDAIARIKKGLYHRLSIGFVISAIKCSIDGQDMRFCQHNVGMWYQVGGRLLLARGIVYNFNGLELSFVNVPASPMARVLDWSYAHLELSERN